MGLLVDVLGELVSRILWPDDRPTARQRIWTAGVLLALLALIVGFVW